MFDGYQPTSKMKHYKIRRLKHPLFRNAPVYIDYGTGCFGTFQVESQANRALAFIEANPQLQKR